jgi:hypothetical protein
VAGLTECRTRAREQRLHGDRRETHIRGNVVHGQFLHVFQFQQTRVFRWQVVERCMHELGNVRPLQQSVGVGFGGPVHRLERRPDRWILFQPHDAAALGRCLRYLVEEFAARDLAEPGIKRRFAAVSVEFAHTLDKGGLHDVTRAVAIARGPAQDEAVQTWKIPVEKLLKRHGVAAEEFFRHL